MTSDLTHYPLSELVIERLKSKIKVRDSSEIGPFPFYTSGIKIARHTESLCTGENIYIATGGKANFQYLNGPAAYSTDTYVVTGSNRIDTKYLYYFLTSKTEYIDEHLFRGAALRHLSRPEFKALQVPLPSLPEQQRIVRLLDEAFDGIAIAKANAEINLQNAYLLLKSQLHSVFGKGGHGWVNKRLDQVCKLQNGFAFKSDSFKNSGVPLLRISNIQDGHIDTGSNLVFIQPQDYREDLNRYLVVQGDLLIAMSGATTGKLGFNNEKTEFYLNQRVGKLEPGHELNKWFLYYFLSTKVEDILRMSMGAAQPNLSAEQINNFIIPIADAAEQEQIVSSLTYLSGEIQRLAAVNTKKLIALKALEYSVLGLAFSGEMGAAA